MEKRITYPKYGMGTITKVEKAEEGYWVTVIFDDGIEKTFLTFMNPLEEK